MDKSGDLLQKGRLPLRNYAKNQKLSRTLLGEAGVDIDPGSLAMSLAQKMGLPILEPTSIYEEPRAIEYERYLGVVMRRGGRFTHPKLAGLDFDEKQKAQAISFVVAADRVVMDLNAKPSTNTIVQEMAENKAFVDATLEGNRSEQLRLALYYVAVLSRASQLAERTSNLGVSPFRDMEDISNQAKNDIAIARALIDDYRRLKSGEVKDTDVPAEAAKMLELYRTAEFDPEGTSDFELALKAIDEPVEFAEPVNYAGEESVQIETVEPEQDLLEIEISAEELEEPPAKPEEPLFQVKRNGQIFTVRDEELVETDEVWLTRDECNARDIALAANSLGEFLPVSQVVERFREEVPLKLVVMREDRYLIVSRGEAQPSDRVVTGDELTHAMQQIMEADTEEKEGAIAPDVPPQAYRELHEIPEEEKVSLVFPLPNIGISETLEQMLNARFPKYDLKDKEIKKHKEIRSVARTILNYVNFEIMGEEFRSQFAQFAKEKYGRANVDLTVHPLYKAAVDDVLERARKQNLQESWVIDHAVSIVEAYHRDVEELPEILEAPAEKKLEKVPPPQQFYIDPALIYATLDARELILVSRILGQNTDATVDDLSKFLRMHAGIRQLRLSNFVNSLWTDHTINKAEFASYLAAEKTLRVKCGVNEATPQEKAEAIAQANELTANQRSVIANFFNLGNGKIAPRHITKFGTWASDSRRREAAMNVWKKGKVDLHTLATMVHKFRFEGIYEHSDEEIQLLNEFGHGTDPQAAQSFAHAFTQKTCPEVKNRYYREIMSAFVAFDQIRYWSLPVAARRQAEVNTLLEFLGVPVEKQTVSVEYRNCSLVPMIKNSNGKMVYKDPSDDTISTITIVKEDGTKIMLDAVFDGMGGHEDGHRAAAIAKDVLETAALAGWIDGPEDVRKSLVMADLAIFMEQLSDKGENPDDYKSDTSMGTTAVVGFQKGIEFYYVHSGDSQGRVIRRGRVIFTTEDHSQAYDLKKSGRDVNEEAMRVYLEATKNVIISCLGVAPKYICINNVEGVNYRPIMLEPEDITATDSDGTNEPVCGEHEYSILVEESAGDLEEARNRIMHLATSRIKKVPYQTKCACNTREGKNDDRSLILRYAKDGFSVAKVEGGAEENFFRKFHENPREASTSQTLTDFVSRTIAGGTETAEQNIEMLIRLADTAPKETAMDAYRTAIDTVFLIASQRKDGDEILLNLHSRIGPMGGLILTNLAHSRHADKKQRMMFDFISQTMQPKEFVLLLSVENRHIARWTADFLAQLPTEQKTEMYSRVFGSMMSIFNSQTDANGNPLPAWKTRYLDDTVFDLCDSTVVQDTALKLGILPRDLEIMLFYQHSDFKLPIALGPHNSEEGPNMIHEVSLQLTGHEAGKILEASYYIYCLRNSSLPPEQARLIAELLWSIADGLDPYTSYYVKLSNKASKLRSEYAPAPL